MSYNGELFANRFYFKATNYGKFFKLYYKSKIICSHSKDLGIILSHWETCDIPINLGDKSCEIECSIKLDSEGYRVDFTFPEPVLEQLENGQEKLIMKMLEEYFDEKFGVGNKYMFCQFTRAFKFGNYSPDTLLRLGESIVLDN